jgi:regulator of RNase E activity RraA
MSLWGNKDLVGQAGTVWINLSNETITGTGTTFNTTGFVVSEGDVIVVGAGATYGHAVISSVTSNTVASVATTQYLIPHPTTGIITAAS